MGRRERRSSPSANAEDPYKRQEWCEPGEHPAWIDMLRKTVHLSIKQRLPQLKQKKVLAKDKRRAVRFGPVALPLETLCSSRWCEGRTKLPLACDEATWRIAWEFWRNAETYKKIRASIERHGMRDPIRVDAYVNYQPTENVIPHRCLQLCSHPEKTPFIVAVGNERTLMAWFEWKWKTIPAIVCVRDYGLNPMVSMMLRVLSDATLKRYKRPIVTSSRVTRYVT